MAQDPTKSNRDPDLKNWGGIREAILKKKIKAHLNELKAYWYMPVPGGYGTQTVDFLCCLNGRFLGIETKSTGQKPTPRQMLSMQAIRNAGGVAFWCDSFESFYQQWKAIAEAIR